MYLAKPKTQSMFQGLNRNQVDVFYDVEITDKESVAQSGGGFDTILKLQASLT